MLSAPIKLNGSRQSGLPLPAPQADTSVEKIRLSIRLRFNPLRDFSAKQLTSYLDNFRLGWFRNAALTWDAMERRDDRISVVASKRKKSVSRHGWEILSIDDSPAAEEQKEVLTKFFNRLEATTALEQDEKGGLALLMRQMMDAVGKRYAVHELVWDTSSGDLKCKAIFCPLWWFEGVAGKLRYLENEMSLYGVDLEPNGWMVTVGDGLMEACSVAYVFKHLSLKDWLSFSEKFGMPGLLGETDAELGSEEWTAMESALKTFGEDWAAVVRKNSDGKPPISLIEARTTGDQPFQPLVDRMDQAIATLWRGADLGTSSATDSVGASLQESETDILDLDDAEMLSETIEANITKIARAWYFGADAAPLAYFKVKTAEKTNVDADLKVDAFLLPLGMLTKEALAGRYNRPMPGPDDEVVMPPAPPMPAGAPGRGTEPDDDDEETSLANAADPATSELITALKSDLQPVMDQLSAILKIQDGAIMEQKLKAFSVKLDQLKKDVGADPETARALEKIKSAAFAKGMMMKKPQTKTA